MLQSSKPTSMRRMLQRHERWPIARRLLTRQFLQPPKLRQYDGASTTERLNVFALDSRWEEQRDIATAFAAMSIRETSLFLSATTNI
jgi:hypothetical protein